MELKRTVADVRFIFISVVLLVFLFVSFNREINKEPEQYYIHIGDEENKGYFNENYQQNIENTIKRADKLMTMENSSLVKAKLLKTKKDFESLRDINVSESKAETLSNVTDNVMPSLVIILIGVMLVISFFDERRRGMWNFVHTTVRGRVALSVRRLGIVVFTVSVLTLFSYMVLFAVNWKTTGMPDFSQSIQSFEAYEQLIPHINVGQFIALFVMLKMICNVTIVLAVWFFISLIGNIGLGIVVVAIIEAVECLLFYVIQPNSVGAVFRDINLYSLIDSSRWLKNYTLYGFPFLVAENRVIMLVIAILLLAAFSFFTVVINAGKKPFNYVGIWQTLVEETFIGKAAASLGGFLAEYRKILFFNGGIVVVFLCVFWTAKNFELPEYRYADKNTSLIRYFSDCEKLSLTEAEKYIADLSEELDSMDMDDYRYESFKSNISELTRRLEYAKSFEGRKDVKVLDDTEYVNYFGFREINSRNIKTLILVTALIVIFSYIYSYERKCNMVMFANSTYRGKAKLIRDKIIFVVSVTVFLYAVVFGTNIYMHYYNYGFRFWNLDVANISILGNVNANITVGQFVILSEVLRLAVILASGFLVMLLSKWQTYEKTVILSIIILVFPGVLYISGISSLKNFTIMKLSEIMYLVK